MKKIIFAGYAISEMEALKASGVSIAGNKMQLNILHELSKYDDLIIYPITIYPCASYPKDSKLIYRKKNINLWENQQSTQLGFINLPIVKQACQIWEMYCEIKKQLRNMPDAQILSFNMYPQVGTPLRWMNKKYDVDVTAILADLPIDIKNNRRGISKVLMSVFNLQTKKNIKSLYRAIVLNANAAEQYLSDQKYVVVEGGVHVQENTSKSILIKSYAERKKIIVYSGALVEYNGVQNLIKAMEMVHEDVILRIYGDGPLKPYVECVAKEKSNIEYMGKVSNTEMLGIQKEAYLLINPRPVNDPISQVTFPSKILEYLMSGTVVLSTKMSGFTDAYLDKMILTDDDARSMAKKIDESMRIPFDKMNDMAVKAYKFVTEEKNWKKQGKKIHDFLV